MNIVLIHYSAPPIIGGVETVLARQAQVLVRAGHRVRILAGRGETWDAQIPVQKLPLIDSRHPLILKTRAALDEGSLPDNFYELVDQIENDLTRVLKDSDAVILHNVASIHRNLPLTQALYNFSQEPGAPRFILWHHDLSCASTRTSIELHPGLPWDLLRRHWPGVEQVVVSQAHRSAYAECSGLPEDQIHVISAGLTLLDFLGLKKQTISLVENFHLALAAPLLLTPVRVARRKNLELAIASMAALRKIYPNAMLVITGPARGAGQSSNQSYLNSLQQQRASLGLEGAVHLLAESLPHGLTETALAELYRLADALLLTSREEGFGVPVLEAGLSRLPIFCTNLPSLRELAGEDATYFSPNDSPDLVAARIAERLENDPAYRMRVRVRREHTWDSVYLRQIAPILENRPAQDQE
jgi:mannosylglucosylglycerate synthase